MKLNIVVIVVMLSITLGAFAAEEPLFPDGVNQMLGRIQPDMSEVQVVEIVKIYYQDDPLVHGTVSARWGTELLSAVESVKIRGENMNIPLLMIHGETDRLNSAEGTKKFFDRVRICDKEFVSYPAGYHELHNNLSPNTPGVIIFIINYSILYQQS